MIARSAQRQSGFSLLEVIVGLAIFVGSAAILNELLQQSLLATADHRLRTAALLLAESKLDELASGIEPFSATMQARPVVDSPSWQWTAEMTPQPIAGLIHVVVRVEHLAGEDQPPDHTLELERWLNVPAGLLPSDREKSAQPGAETELPP